MFVASSNGLGHARRLLHLISGFRDFGVSTTLIISEKQELLLYSEIKEAQRISRFKVCVSAPQGLEVIGNNIEVLPFVQDTKYLKEIESASAVISDNSLWPTEFHEKVYLLGHFEWVTYFTKKMEGLQVATYVQDLLAKERANLSRIAKWFRTKDFYMKSFFEFQTVEIPLIRYHSDSVEIQERVDEIWLSYGTTSRNIPEPLPVIRGDLKLVNKESWRLNEGNLPHAILGRPGLGTIRDCLAHAVCFSPFWTGVDPELTSNSGKLFELKLSLPTNKILQGEIDNSELKRLQERIYEYWQTSSSQPESIAALILANIK